MNKKILKINKALFQIIAISRFMRINMAGIKAGRMSLKAVVVSNIQKVGKIVGVTKALRYLDLNFQQYARLKEISLVLTH